MRCDDAFDTGRKCREGLIRFDRLSDVCRVVVVPTVCSLIAHHKCADPIRLLVGLGRIVTYPVVTGGGTGIWIKIIDETSIYTRSSIPNSFPL